MGVEWVAGLLVVLAVICLGAAAILFFRARWFLQWLRGTAGFLLAGTSLYLVFIAASLFGYQQARSDAPLVIVSFEKTAAQSWNVTLAEANGDRRVFKLQGDLWQLDVRLLRYKGPAGVFGTQPSFRLERLSGRYLSIEDAATKEHTEFDLMPKPFLGFDIWERAEAHGSLIVTASRSNVALVPIAVGAIYEVWLGEGGLALRAVNSAAEDALKSVGE